MDTSILFQERGQILPGGYRSGIRCGARRAELRLEHNPSPQLCPDTGSEGRRAAGDTCHRAGDEGRPPPAQALRAGAGAGLCRAASAPGAEPALPQPRPRSPHGPRPGRAPRPPPGPSGARDRSRRRGLPPPPRLPRRWDLPGRGARAARTCAHQQ